MLDDRPPCVRGRARWSNFWFAVRLSVLAACSFGASLAKAGPLEENPSKPPLTFEVAYPDSLRNEPISARVYVLLGPEAGPGEPRFGPDWFDTQPFFAVDSHAWKPGESLTIDDHADSFPGPLSSLKPGRYAIQAVVRFNLDTHEIGGEGNGYGPVVKAELDPAVGGAISLKIDSIVARREFEETDRIRLVEIPSPLLSQFHGRPIQQRAAVILPKSLEKGRKYPTLYMIPGFGGDHFLATRFAQEPRFAYGRDFIRVILDPDCSTGHHVFADSENNGPRGRALIEEFIPHIEAHFPAIADSRARLLNGHSSGGWSSLWLQVTYPEVFGGTWSTSPDPVDFRDFQKISLYEPGENMFRDREGQRRPIARKGERPFLYYDRFSLLDDVIGFGGQLSSFEAVFSPKGADGKPRKLWNRSTGAIDPEIARTWEAYDIRLVLERNWETLGPKLTGKLHIVTGSLDTFYLEGAVELLKDSLKTLKSDAQVTIIPGRDHRTVLDTQLAEQFDSEMKAAVESLSESKPAGAR